MVLDTEDWEVLASVKLHSDEETSPNPTHAAWLAWERSLRSELARQRAQKLGVDAGPYVKTGIVSQTVLDTARAAMADCSPEQAEGIILRAHWTYLDDLEVCHHFDLDKLVVYFLKLQVLALKHARNKEDGLRMFSAQYEAIRTRQ